VAPPAIADKVVAPPPPKDDDLMAALIGTTPWEKFKSTMAGIGAIALFLLTSRAFRK
jgi:hypothetical protein